MNASGPPLRSAAPLRFGDVSIDAAARTVRVGGAERHLEPRALDLLLYLIAARGRAVAKDELLARVWPGRVVEEGALKQAVWSIRQALGDDPRAPRFVRTVRGTGYRFVAEPSALDGAPSRRRPVRWWLPLGAAVVLLLLVLVNPWRDVGGTGAEPVRLLILPFDNATGDAHLDWVSRGLPALVAHGLVDTTGLALIAPGVGARLAEDLGFDFDADAAAFAELGRLAGADWVVAGSVRGEPQAWALHLRSLGPVGEIEDRRLEASELGELAAAVGADALRMALQGSMQVSMRWPSADPFVNELHARGLAAYQIGDSRNARDLLALVARALPEEPHVRLDLALAEYALGQRDEALALAAAVAEDAPASPTLALRLAHFQGDAAADAGDLDLARRHYLAALEQAQVGGDRVQVADALRALGSIDSRAGAWEDAEQHLGRALAEYTLAGHEPGRMRALNNLGVLEWRRDRIGESARWHEQALASARRQGRREVEASSLGNLATIAFSQRRIDEARDWNVQALTLHRELGNRRSEVLVLGNMARHAAHAHRLGEARSMAEEMLVAADDLGDAALAAFARIQLGLIELHSGDYRLSAEWFDDAARRFQASGDIDYAISARTHQVRSLILAGDSTEARKLFQDSEAELLAAGSAHTRAQVVLTQAWLAAASGLGAEAIERAQQARALAAESGSLDLIDTITFDLAMFLLRAGRSEEGSVWLGQIDSGETHALRRRLAQARFAYETGEFARAVELMEAGREMAGEGWLERYEVELGRYREAERQGLRVPLGDELP
ncbi:MAG TPA: tetratricopeptide repeat protein [Xanthomonadaceae bacterium]|nr:tetratricopeptide repeat protein [Xanthomonadaceae bacterium]